MRGIDPVEAYLCDEGLARFCTHNYKKPDTNNIKDIYMHLTNFSVNKNNFLKMIKVQNNYLQLL